jgi:uncharacterized protein
MKDHALITGASNGIGLELAREFAKHRIDLVLVARSETKLKEIASDLTTRHGIHVLVIAADLSKPDAAQEIYRRILEEKLFIGYLVNNAGFGNYGRFSETSWKKEESMIALNITALTQLCKLFIQPMKENRRGRIMNVASVAAFLPGPLMAVYYATKAFVLSFSEALSNEVKEDGITVTALCPGPTASGFEDAADLNDSKLFKGKSLPGAQEVAQFGYTAMMKGKRVAVHGLMNRLQVFFIKFAPRSQVVKVVRMMSEKA